LFAHASSLNNNTYPNNYFSKLLIFIFKLQLFGAYPENIIIRLTAKSGACLRTLQRAQTFKKLAQLTFNLLCTANTIAQNKIKFCNIYQRVF
jgi:Mn2+/Fe2+ NRAMP family transporter